ncbi:hypothetical protein Ae201684_009177 [Aphanomyces euteiches]|uniref:Kinesin motor domain-containing protein n=1 Tax=Aphanomyces euteiches TaxID=100861 RepID=A0A6G0X2J2_9STRA|nr:hypothetical protein Ae201684_009177 [Aphanomyces euteiches]
MAPITVVGRVARVRDAAEPGLAISNSSVTWIHHAEEKQFFLDKVIDVDDDAAWIGDALVESALDGINAAVLAFGQQGAGKSTTIFGTEAALPGLVSYVGSRLCTKCTVTISVVEHYGNVAVDVLKGKAYSFRPQTHRLVGAYGLDVTRLALPDATTLDEVLRMAVRAMALDCIAQNKTATKLSRIVTLYVESSSQWSRVDFVDMAASGTSRRVQAATDVGFRFEQGHLNFAKCIRLLADDVLSIPFDEAALTTLIAHTLGNSDRSCKTFAVAHVIQSVLCNEENLATLRLALLFQSIQVPSPACQSSSRAMILDHLDAEQRMRGAQLDRLKLQLAREEKSIHQSKLEADYQATRRAIKHLESLMHDFHKTPLDLHDDWLKLKRRVDNLEVALGAKVLATSTPYIHLIRLHEDRLFSGLVAYHIAASDTKIGREPTSGLVLFGAGCDAHQCDFVVLAPGEAIRVVPRGKSVSLVNDVQLVEPQIIEHDDILTFGRRNVFRVIDPDKPQAKHIGDRPRRRCKQGLSHDDATKRCHKALAAILERITSIRTMFTQSLVPQDDDEADVTDIFLQKGVAPQAKSMSDRMRAETIRHLSSASIAEMNVLESRIGQGYAMDLVDAVDEAVAICAEMDKRVLIEAVPMVNHIVTTRDDEPVDRMQLSTDIWILMQSIDAPKERIILRPHDFHIRMALLRTHFQAFLGRSTSWLEGGSNDDGDPLQLEATAELIGRASVFLGSLAYYLAIDEAVPIVSDRGVVVGTLAVQIEPYVPQSRIDPSTQREVVTYIAHVNTDVDKEETLANAIGMHASVEYHIKIRGARGLPPALTSNVFVEYLFFQDDQFQSSEPSACKSRHPWIEQEFVHRAEITEELCQYIAGQSLEFHVYGYRGDHVVAGPKQKRDEMYWMDMESKAMKAIVQNLQDKVATLEYKLEQCEEEKKICLPTSPDHQPNDEDDEQDQGVLVVPPPEPAEAKIVQTACLAEDV